MHTVELTPKDIYESNCIRREINLLAVGTEFSESLNTKNLIIRGVEDIKRLRQVQDRIRKLTLKLLAVPRENIREEDDDFRSPYEWHQLERSTFTSIKNKDTDEIEDDGLSSNTRMYDYHTVLQPHDVRRCYPKDNKRWISE